LSKSYHFYLFDISCNI